MTKNKNRFIEKFIISEDGSETISGLITFGLIIVILFSIVFGGYTYFIKNSENARLNYNLGRYVATLEACDGNSLESLNYLPQYVKYNIKAIVNGSQQVVINTVSEPNGHIMVNCGTSEWKKGNYFSISTSMNTNPAQILPFFAEVTSKGEYYVIE